MHDDELPRSIDIGRLAAGEHAWTGTLAGESLPRIHEIGGSASEVAGSITLTVGHQHPGCRGDCRAVVTMDCERCHSPVSLAVEVAFDLIVVDRIAEADSYDAETPVVVAPRGWLDVITVLEDEIILGLPLIPMHEDMNCDGGQRQFGPADEPAPVRENPFQVLESLKRSDSGETH